MYLTYTMENYKYIFTTDKEHWEDSMSYQLLYVEILADGKGKLSGPRGIHIGDDFESVIKKFPQEKRWEESTEGIFYGDSRTKNESELEKGSVTTFEDGKVDFITLVPKGNPPFLKIHFKNNQVKKMIIYCMGD